MSSATETSPDPRTLEVDDVTQTSKTHQSEIDAIGIAIRIIVEAILAAALSMCVCV